MRHFQILTVVTATIAIFPQVIFAQGATDYPNKAVRIIAAAGVGGGADVIARILGQKLSENLKNQFVVENRPGAGDTIGIALTAKSAPDGYTLMVATPSLTIAPAVNPAFTIDPIKDFVPISLTNKAPYLLAVHPSLPVKTVKELVALARAKPGTIDVGVIYGGTMHLATAYFASMANIKITHIPYSVVGQVLTDTMAGRIQGFILPIQTTMPAMRSGRVRVLAVTSAERIAELPDVPTVAESGVLGYDAAGWYGWIAPAGTPSAIVSKLNAELIKALRSPEISKRMADDSIVVVGNSPEQFGQFIASEFARWSKVVKDLGIKVQ